MRARRGICVLYWRTHMHPLGDAYASPRTHMRDRPDCSRGGQTFFLLDKGGLTIIFDWNRGGQAFFSHVK